MTFPEMALVASGPLRTCVSRWKPQWEWPSLAQAERDKQNWAKYPDYLRTYDWLKIGIKVSTSHPSTK